MGWNQGIHRNFDMILDALRLEKSKNSVLLQALEEIIEGKGTFSINHLEHASNTINEMTEIARKALANIDKLYQCDCCGRLFHQNELTFIRHDHPNSNAHMDTTACDECRKELK